MNVWILPRKIWNIEASRVLIGAFRNFCVVIYFQNINLKRSFYFLLHQKIPLNNIKPWMVDNFFNSSAPQSIFGIKLKKSFNDVFSFVWKLNFTGEMKLSFQYLLLQILLIVGLSLESSVPINHFINYAPKTPIVYFFGIQLSPKNFWSDVKKGSTKRFSFFNPNSW